MANLKSACPDCNSSLHVGQHKFADGLFEVWYCKECGYRKEVPLNRIK